MANKTIISTANTPPIKPSDAKSWSLCARRVWLDNKAELELTTIEDAFEQLVIDLGLAHEQTVLQRLSGTLTVHTATSLEDTNRVIAERVPVIYQAQLVDEEPGLIGFHDFLIIDESGQYQAADAKLSLSELNKEIQVQLGVYRRMLNSQLPTIVILCDGE